MKQTFLKSQTGLTPADQQAKEWFDSVPAGKMVSGDFTKKQNPAFHRKMFALLQVGYENWQQPELEVMVGGRTVTPEKNFDRFRRDLTILAGFYHVVYRLDGSFRIEADSLSFDRMPADERERVYSKFIDLLIANVYGGQITEDDMHKIVETYLAFA